MRLFIAVAADEEVKAAAAAAIARLRRVAGDYRWMDPRDMHTTLRFLGETPEASLPEIEALCAAAAAQTAPFEIVYGRVGAFDSLEDPRVVMITVDEAVPSSDKRTAPMERLANLLGRDEPRPYSAHLTLGRRRGGASATEFLAALKAEPILGLRRPVTKISLYADRAIRLAHAYEILLEADLIARG